MPLDPPEVLASAIFAELRTWDLDNPDNYLSRVTDLIRVDREACRAEALQPFLDLADQFATAESDFQALHAGEGGVRSDLLKAGVWCQAERMLRALPGGGGGKGSRVAGMGQDQPSAYEQQEMLARAIAAEEIIRGAPTAVEIHVARYVEKAGAGEDVYPDPYWDLPYAMRLIYLDMIAGVMSPAQGRLFNRCAELLRKLSTEQPTQRPDDALPQSKPNQSADDEHRDG